MEEVNVRSLAAFRAAAVASTGAIRFRAARKDAWENWRDRVDPDRYQAGINARPVSCANGYAVQWGRHSQLVIDLCPSVITSSSD